MQIYKLLGHFAVSVLFAAACTVPLSAQETKQKELKTETKDIKESVAEVTNKNEFLESKIVEKSEISEFRFETPKTAKTFDGVKSETSQEQQVDDTMMGVMGKGSDRIKLGGHVGFVVPIVARGNGVTTNLADRFVFGFPVGLTLKTKRNIAVDFEFIPTFNTGRDFVLTIHPGIIYGFKKKYAVGVRAAYDAGAGSFGFTPLISRGFKVSEKVGFFIEADFPIRSNYRAYQDRFGSIAFAMHAGFAF